MIGAALLIPAGLLATQITISEVSAEREAGRVAITVKGDAMIDPEAASAKLTDGHLYLFVRDARVREANQSWANGAADGAEEIRAHRHKQKVELAVPLGDGECQGPVEFEASPGGLRALVACEDGPQPAAARVKHPAASRPAPNIEAAAKSAASRPAPNIDAVAKLAAPAPLPASEAAALKAKLSLEPAPGQPGEGAESVTVAAAQRPPVSLAAPKATATQAAKSTIGVGVGVGDTKAPTGATKPAAAITHGSGAGTAKIDLPASPVPAAPLAPAPAPGTSLAAGTATGSSGTGGGAMLGGFALVAIAAAAFYFSRRRRAVSRHIEILETASLGPKRTLIVARVGGARMILGSSEAGITLIQALPEMDIGKDGATAALAIDSAPVEEAQWDAMVTATLTPPGGVPLPSQASSAAAMALMATATQTAAPTPTPTPTLAPTLPTTTTPAPMLTIVRTEAAERFEDMRIEVEEAPNPTSEIRLTTGDDRPLGQAGVLSRLFRRGGPANDATAPRFEDILEDSFEDQELRRKLALGLPGRVR